MIIIFISIFMWLLCCFIMSVYFIVPVRWIWILLYQFHCSFCELWYGVKNNNKIMGLRTITLLENAFERLGRFIARWPYLVIASCVLCTGLCSIGFLNLRFNSDIYEIWNTNPTGRADESQAVLNKEWISNNYVDGKRIHTFTFRGVNSNDENILTPEALQVMLEFHNKISQPFQNISFQDICYR